MLSSSNNLIENSANKIEKLSIPRDLSSKDANFINVLKMEFEILKIIQHNSHMLCAKTHRSVIHLYNKILVYILRRGADDYSTWLNTIIGNVEFRLQKISTEVIKAGAAIVFSNSLKIAVAKCEETSGESKAIDFANKDKLLEIVKKQGAIRKNQQIEKKITNASNGISLMMAGLFAGGSIASGGALPICAGAVSFFANLGYAIVSNLGRTQISEDYSEFNNKFYSEIEKNFKGIIPFIKQQIEYHYSKQEKIKKFSKVENNLIKVLKQYISSQGDVKQLNAIDKVKIDDDVCNKRSDKFNRILQKFINEYQLDFDPTKNNAKVEEKQATNMLQRTANDSSSLNSFNSFKSR
jgi:hypothetical protein